MIENQGICALSVDTRSLARIRCLVQGSRLRAIVTKRLFEHLGFLRALIEAFQMSCFDFPVTRDIIGITRSGRKLIQNCHAPVTSLPREARLAKLMTVMVGDCHLRMHDALHGVVVEACRMHKVIEKSARLA